MHLFILKICACKVFIRRMALYCHPLPYSCITSLILTKQSCDADISSELNQCIYILNEMCGLINVLVLLRRFAQKQGLWP